MPDPMTSTGWGWFATHATAFLSSVPCLTSSTSQNVRSMSRGKYTTHLVPNSRAVTPGRSVRETHAYPLLR